METPNDFDWVSTRILGHVTSAKCMDYVSNGPIFLLSFAGVQLVKVNCPKEAREVALNRAGKVGG